MAVLTIREFKEQNPAYANRGDQELADALYLKFYAGKIDRLEFMERVGVAARDTPAPPKPQPPEDRGTPDPLAARSAPPAGPSAPRPPGEPAEFRPPEGERFTAPPPSGETGLDFPDLSRGVEKPPPESGAWEDRGRRFARGMTDLFSRFPEFGAIMVRRGAMGRAEGAENAATDFIDQIKSLSAILESDTTPQGRALTAEEREFYTEELARLHSFAVQAVETAIRESDTPEAQDTPLYKLGEELRSLSTDVFGEPDPARDEDFTSKLAEGTGSAAGFLATGIAAMLMGGGPLAGAVTAGATGATATSASLYDEAIAAGASEEVAQEAARIGVAIGSLEGAPLFNILKPLTQRFPGIENRLGKALGGVLASAGEEGAQEAMSGVLQNITAAGLWDPERGWADGVTEQAIIGAIIGAGLRGGTEAAAAAVDGAGAALKAGEELLDRAATELNTRGAARDMTATIEGADITPTRPVAPEPITAPPPAGSEPVRYPTPDEIDEVLGLKPVGPEPAPGPASAVTAKEQERPFNYGDYVVRLIGHESGGRVDAKNELSTASGPEQWLKSTWLDIVRRHGGPEYEGMTEAQILALRTEDTPEAARLRARMLKAFTDENIAALERAGQEVNDTTVYMTHFFGAQGAIKVLRADPETRIEEIVTGDVIAANPHLRGMTAAQVRRWASQAIGRGGDLPPADTVEQPDMLGGETLTEEEVVTRDEVRRLLAEADLTGKTDYELVREYLDAGARDGAPILRELTRRGALGQRIITEGYDFDQTVPAPQPEALAEQLADPMTGLLAKDEEAAFVTIKSFFAEEEELAKRLMRGVQGAMDAGDMELAKSSLDDLATRFEGISEAYGPSVAEKFAKRLKLDIPLLRQRVARAAKRVDATAGGGGTAGQTGAAAGAQTGAPTPQEPRQIGVNVDGEPVFEDGNGVRHVVRDGIRITEPVRVGPRGEVQGPGDRAGTDFETVEGEGVSAPGESTGAETGAAAEPEGEETNGPKDTSITPEGASGQEVATINEKGLPEGWRKKLDEALTGKGFKSITEARKLLGEILGEPVEPGTPGAKRADELIETRILAAAIEIINDTEPGVPTFRKLVELYRRQPRLGVRTSTSIENQAYSTPVPLAYLAAWRIGLNDKRSFYEPTAGNGALLMTTDPRLGMANELDPARADELDAEGFRVTQNDAAEWTPSRTFDTVIANPPFGGRDGKSWNLGDGYRTKEIDHAISVRALSVMADTGTAALIVGAPNKTLKEEARKDAYNGKAKREFFLYLKERYNVIDHFTVSGDLYDKQGASWPVDVIIIDGRGESKRPLPAVELPRIYDSWKELEEVFRDGQLQPTGGRSENPRAGSGGGGGGGGPGGGGRGSEGAVRGGGETRDGGDPGERQSDEPTVRDDGQPAAPVLPDEPREPGPSDAGAGQDRGSSQPTERARPVGDGPQIAYEPASKAGRSLNTLSPANMAQAMHAALAQLERTHGSVDNFVAAELGMKLSELGDAFGGEQIDALALAIDNAKRGSGFIIGDQTGIGKGRVVAGMMRWAIRQKLKPVFVTEKPDLYLSMLEDMEDIGLNKMLGREVRPLVTNGDLGVLETADGRYRIDARTHGKGNMLGDKAIAEHDAIFTLYSQMNTQAGKETERRHMLARLAPRAFIVMDESHNAGGQDETRGSDKTDEGEKKAPNRATFARQLVRTAAGVMYSSATYAKRPSVMTLYSRTDMALAVSDVEQLAEAIGKGGVPMQQAVAQMLTAAGQYVRRERDFTGIRYETMTVETERALYNTASGLLAEIQSVSEKVTSLIKNVSKEIRNEAKKLAGDTSIGAAGATSTNFTSVMHNVIEALILSFTAKPAVERALDALKRGRKPVIALSFTMETMLSDYAESVGIKPGDEANLTLNRLFTNYLERLRHYTVVKPFQKGSERKYLSDDDLGPDLVAEFERVRKLIEAVDFGDLPASPIDYIRAGISAAGYSVREITGRSTQLEYRRDGTQIYRRRDKEEIGSKKGKQRTKDSFNNGDLDAVILNQSGATGISLHASENFKDQRGRTMILVQPERNIDTHMQMLGRVNRTGQVVKPEYEQLVANIPATIRPAAVLAKKMASLNAATIAARRSAVSADEDLDLLNVIGDVVAYELVDETPGLNARLGDVLKINADTANIEDAARRVTGRLPLLPIEDQEAIYGELMARFRAELARRIEAGENPLETRTVEALNDFNEDEATVAIAASGVSPFQSAVVSEIVEVRRPRRPQTAAELATEITGEDVAPGAAVTALDRLSARGPTEEALEALEEARKFFADAIAGAKSDEARSNWREREAELTGRFSSTVREYTPGSAVRLTIGEGAFTYGVVTEIENTGRTVNPIALSAWDILIRVPGGFSYTMPFSKVSEESLAPASLANTLEAFDAAAKKGNTEHRIFLSGNVLAAYEYARGKGQVVNLKRPDGTIEPGFLADSGFDPNVDAMRLLRSGDEIMEQLAQLPDGTEIATLDGHVVVHMHRGTLVVSVARSKRDGGIYFLDRTIRDLAGRDFVSSGQRMMLYLAGTEAAAKPVLDQLVQLGAKFQKPESDPDELGMAPPMPNAQPLYSQIHRPPRPRSGRLTVAGRKVQLRPADDPTRARGITNLVERLIGPRVYQSKIKGKTRLGFYRRRPGELRLRNFDEVEVLAHEMAHWMEFHSSQRGYWGKFRRGQLVKNNPQIGAMIKDEIEAVSYTSDPRLKGYEGFAEFIRLWLTRHDAAVSVAPTATAAFGKALDTMPREYRSLMRRIQDEMHRYYYQGDLANMRAKIGRDASLTTEINAFLGSQPAARFRQNTIDNIHAAKIVERTLTGDLGPARVSPYKLLQIANGAESVHEAIIRYGAPKVEVDGSLSFDGKGLREILWPVQRSRKKFDLAMTYFAARRAHELMQQGRERLFTRAEIRAGLQIAKQLPEVEQVFAEWTEFNGKMLAFYEAMGLITADQRNAFEDMNRDYVPFHRVIERIEERVGPTPGRQVGRRLYGGDRNVQDVGVNIVEGLLTNIRQALIARGRNMLFEQIAKSDDGAMFAAKIPKDSRKVTVHLEEQARRVAQILADLGLTVSKNGMTVGAANPVTDTRDIEAALKANPELLQYWLHGYKPKTQETMVVSAIVDGELQWFEVRDRLLVDMFENMRGLHVSVWLRLAFAVKNFMTRTVTAMIQFLGGNLMRDTVSAALLSKKSFIPIYDTLIGVGHFFARSKLYKDFMLQGAGYGTRIEAYTAESRARRNIDIRPASMWGWVQRFLASYDHVVSAFEYGSRIAEYRRNVRSGVSKQDATWLAREITTDFSKRGSSHFIRAFMATVPFMNASIQGIDREAREIGEYRGKMTVRNIARFNRAKLIFAAKASVLVGMSLVLWGWNDDDERWHQLTADERARYWWIFWDKDRAPIRIPKPHGLGALFGTMPEMIADRFFGNAELGGQDSRFARKVMAYAGYQALAFWDYPGIVQPILEDIANETFTGAPIVPPHMKDMPPEWQYRDSTPELYRQLGRELGISPLVAQHYVKGYTRYLEQYISDASEAALWREDLWGERPFARGVVDYVAYHFVGREVPYRTRYTDGFYDLRSRASGARAAVARAQADAVRGDDAPRAAAADRQLAALAELDSDFRKMTRMLGQIGDAADAIKYDPDLSGEEKEARIEALYRDRNDALEAMFTGADRVLRQIERTTDQ